MNRDFTTNTSGVGLLTNMDIFREDVLAGKSIFLTVDGRGLCKETGKALAVKAARDVIHVSTQKDKAGRA